MKISFSELPRKTVRRNQISELDLFDSHKPGGCFTIEQNLRLPSAQSGTAQQASLCRRVSYLPLLSLGMVTLRRRSTPHPTRG
jgi:hypothetical protein